MPTATYLSMQEVVKTYTNALKKLNHRNIMIILYSFFDCSFNFLLYINLINKTAMHKKGNVIMLNE